jgi:hypothetical protein
MRLASKAARGRAGSAEWSELFALALRHHNARLSPILGRKQIAHIPGVAVRPSVGR